MKITHLPYKPNTIQRHCYACREIIGVRDTWQIMCFKDGGVEVYFSHFKCIGAVCARIVRYRLAS